MLFNFLQCTGQRPHNTELSDYLALNVNRTKVEESSLQAGSGPGIASLPFQGHQTLI